MNEKQIITKINVTSNEKYISFNDRIDTTGRVNEKLSTKFNKNDVISTTSELLPSDENVYSSLNTNELLNQLNNSFNVNTIYTDYSSATEDLIFVKSNDFYTLMHKVDDDYIMYRVPEGSNVYVKDSQSVFKLFEYTNTEPDNQIGINDINLLNSKINIYNDSEINSVNYNTNDTLLLKDVSYDYLTNNCYALFKDNSTNKSYVGIINNGNINYINTRQNGQGYTINCSSYYSYKNNVYINDKTTTNKVMLIDTTISNNDSSNYQDNVIDICTLQNDKYGISHILFKSDGFKYVCYNHTGSIPSNYKYLSMISIDTKQITENAVKFSYQGMSLYDFVDCHFVLTYNNYDYLFGYNTMKHTIGTVEKYYCTSLLYVNNKSSIHSGECYFNELYNESGVIYGLFSQITGGIRKDNYAYLIQNYSNNNMMELDKSQIIYGIIKYNLDTNKTEKIITTDDENIDLRQVYNICISPYNKRIFFTVNGAQDTIYEIVNDEIKPIKLNTGKNIVFNNVIITKNNYLYVFNDTVNFYVSNKEHDTLISNEISSFNNNI